MDFRPLRTARARLTALFGTLFLAAGAVLLGIANILVDRSTDTAVYSPQPQPPAPTGTLFQSDRIPAQGRDLQAQLRHLHSYDVHQFLIRSGIALGATALVAVVLGYFVAGRALRPVRTITVKARMISAHNLHERLALAGPADELRELAQTFDDLMDRLEQAFHAQRQFIANASHELRTPLARQRAIAEVALDDPDPTIGSLRAAHERIIAAGAHQEAIIEALLALARGQAGTDRHDRIELAAVADQAVAACRARTSLRAPDRIAVHTSLAPAPVIGDARLIERLAVNLVDNALRYNLEGGQVWVSTYVADGRSVLTVSNTGSPIPADAIDRLRQPFRRLETDRVGRRDGLGLGLSIVQAVADAHRGIVAIRPRPEGGLSIEVAFPLSPAIG
ncbi:histidine kinase [Catenulispora acidiphila DSM 44928]|uniref:histidine kinase n=1 Tax=Catenulispora acidiphila (strain DSM 44928 / JCM 14897 / NBRC 102108 / NRRL B-24433 / ID139908) TaxID=479433 RepID=C7PZZ7_CATAD|nr:HAMP domain-containing sensor histidine kinase [Catenulispora acidiphila]ACU75490.1 histidine kinase [Catenulispora acidiphila DSM 44928]